MPGPAFRGKLPVHAGKLAVSSKFVWQGLGALSTIGRDIAYKLELSAAVVEGKARKSMSTAKHGKVYQKPHTKATWRASAPGEAPAVRTGALKSSVKHWDPFRSLWTWHCYVGTDAQEGGRPYPYYLEVGTRKMQPRPWLVPALFNSRNQIMAIFRKPVHVAGTGGGGRLGFGRIPSFAPSQPSSHGFKTTRIGSF